VLVEEHGRVCFTAADFSEVIVLAKYRTSLKALGRMSRVFLAILSEFWEKRMLGFKDRDCSVVECHRIVWE
jgi:hypothetical protein